MVRTWSGKELQLAHLKCEPKSSLDVSRLCGCQWGPNKAGNAYKVLADRHMSGMRLGGRGQERRQEMLIRVWAWFTLIETLGPVGVLNGLGEIVINRLRDSPLPTPHSHSKNGISQIKAALCRIQVRDTYMCTHFYNLHQQKNPCCDSGTRSLSSQEIV